MLQFCCKIGLAIFVGTKTTPLAAPIAPVITPLSIICRIKSFNISQVSKWSKIDSSRWDNWLIEPILSQLFLKQITKRHEFHQQKKLCVWCYVFTPLIYNDRYLICHIIIPLSKQCQKWNLIFTDIHKTFRD